MDNMQYNQQPQQPQQQPQQPQQPFGQNAQQNPGQQPGGAPYQAPGYQYHNAYAAQPNAAHGGQKPPKPPKPPKKHGSGAAVRTIAVAVAAAIVGGVGGGVAAGSYVSKTMSKQLEQVQATQPVQEEETVQTSTQPDYTHTAASSSGDLTAAQVYSENVNAVVGITSEGTTTNVFGQTSAVASSGSGFIISTDGYIVTNYHVVQGATTLTVTLYNGEEYDATVVGYEASNDVALLKIDATDLTAVTVGDSDALQVGDQVLAIGNPLGELTFTMTGGYISALDREINTDGTPLNMMQTDVAINSGNSGGPLFDMNGQVVGITTAKYSGSTSSGTSIEGIGFAIPINDVMKIVNDLKEYGYVKDRAYLGIGAKDLDQSTAQTYSLPMGVYVASVEEGSCAEKAGVQAGDIITGIGSYQVESYTDLAASLKKFSAGDSTTLSLYRAGAELSVEITLDEKPRDDAASQQTDSTDETQQEEDQQQTPDAGQQQPGMDSEMFDQWYNYFFGQQR